MKGALVSGRPALPQAVLAGRVIAIARGVAAEKLLDAAGALAGCGIGALEVTLGSPDAIAAIERLSRRFDPAELTIGAGTIRDLDGAQAAINAGAAFLVAPHTDVEVVGWAAREGVPMLPGAFSPTELLAGWNAGAAALKLFPAEVGGPDYVRAVRAPLPDLPLVPTGGITDANAAAFLRAGAIAVGVGGWLLGNADRKFVRRRAAALMAAIERTSTE